MSDGQWVVPADVRAYANFTATTGRYGDGNLGSNILTAQGFLERATGRQWRAETATKTFSTNGQAQIAVPDFRSVTALTLGGATLTQDSGWWALPSKQDNAVYTGIQVRPFTSRADGPWYLSIPEWFDRDLDSPYYPGGPTGSLPNDLRVTAAWGWNPVPHEVLTAVKILAAWYTLRPDSVLANARVTPEGALLAYGDLPPEVTAFIEMWRAGTQAVLAG